MNSKTKKILFNVLYAVGAVVVIFAIWYVMSIAIDSELVAPSPWKVIALTFTLLIKGSTYLALLSTLARSLIAFVVSLAVALGLSLLAGLFPKCKTVIDCVVTFFRAVPTMSFILITLIIAPSTVVPSIVAFMVAFPIAYSAFTREIYADAKLMDVCNVYGVTKLNKTKYVLLPNIGKAVVPQIKDTLPFCIKIVIAGEALSLPRHGLGQQMYIAKVNLDTANVLALTILALAVCFIIQGVIALCNRKKAK
ncbi:MAG: hypothetical protein K2M64_04265 [Clostridia bacterium]|nr:hypothetical protein [Clostridia bacterium]